METWLVHVKEWGLLVVELAGLLVYVVRNEALVKARVASLEKDLEVFKTKEFADFKTKEFADFKLAVKEHDLTLWTKIDGIRTDITQILQSLTRLQTIVEISRKDSR